MPIKPIEPTQKLIPLRTSGFTNPVGTRAANPNFQRGQNSNNIGDAFGALPEMAFQRQDELDTEAVNRTESFWKTNETEQLRNYKQRLGINAQDVSQQAQQWFDQKGRDSEDEPTPSRQDFENAYDNLTPVQRKRFDNNYIRRRANFIENVAAHEGAERKKSVLLANNNSISASVESAVENYTDPDAIQSEINNIVLTLGATGRTMGWDEDQAEAQLDTVLETVHKGVIDRYVASGDPESAQAYFTKVKGEIPGLSKAPIEKTIKERLVLVKSQAQTDRIIKLPRRKQLEEARNIKNAEIRKNTQIMVRRIQADQDAQKVQDYRKAKDEIYELVTTHDAPSIHELPADKWSLMTVSDKQTFENLISKQGEPVITNADHNIALDGFMRAHSEALGSDEKKAAFLNMYIPTDFHGKIKSGVIPSLIKLQNEVRNAKPEELQSVVSISQIRDRGLEEMGLNSANGSQFRGQFLSEVQDEILSLEADGVKVTPAKYKEIFKVVQGRNIGGLIQHVKAKKAEESKDKDPFTLAQQMKSYFEFNQLTGKDNEQRRGAITREVDSRISKIQSGGVTLTSQQKALVIESVGTDEVHIDTFGFDKTKLFSELTEEEKADPDKIYVEIAGRKVTLAELNGLGRQDKKSLMKAVHSQSQPITHVNLANAWVSRTAKLSVRPKAFRKDKDSSNSSTSPFSALADLFESEKEEETSSPEKEFLSGGPILNKEGVDVSGKILKRLKHFTLEELKDSKEGLAGLLIKKYGVKNGKRIENLVDSLISG